MSKHKLSNQALLNKARLWFILHHMNIHSAEWSCRLVKCPNQRIDGVCILTWPRKMSINDDLTKIANKSDDQEIHHCIEWIKYV